MPKKNNNNQNEYKWFFDAYETYCHDEGLTPNKVPPWLKKQIDEVIEHNYCIGRSPQSTQMGHESLQDSRSQYLRGLA